MEDNYVQTDAQFKYQLRKRLTGLKQKLELIPYEKLLAIIILKSLKIYPCYKKF